MRYRWKTVPDARVRDHPDELRTWLRRERTKEMTAIVQWLLAYGRSEKALRARLLRALATRAGPETARSR